VDRLSEKDLAASRNLKRIWEEKRDRLGLTQRKAAKIMGMANQSAVSHYLNAQRPLTFSVTLKFARLLGIDPREIRADLDELRLETYGLINTRVLQEARAIVKETLKNRGVVVDDDTEANIVAHAYNRLVRRETVNGDIINVIIDHELMAA
jgi:transcriptional regulator with XRE-family HTH domain